MGRCIDIYIHIHIYIYTYIQLKSGHFSVQKSMTVTITCDHRHIYGASAAEFLKDLADLIENNTQSLLMG
jgi:pyruvate/2-oxoglutarate dehydrogenase complex dihydrolipoamide acyltransferase (E2) component